MEMGGACFALQIYPLHVLHGHASVRNENFLSGHTIELAATALRQDSTASNLYWTGRYVYCFLH